LAFNPPDKVELLDASTGEWVESTSPEDYYVLFTGGWSPKWKSISNSYNGIRFTWTSFPYSWIKAIWMYISPRNNKFNVKMELSSDGNTWEQVLYDTNLGGWPAYYIHVFDKTISNRNIPYLRITIEINWVGTITTVSIGGIRLLAVYDWISRGKYLPFTADYARNLTFYGNLNPDTDNAHDLGNSSYRWRNIHGINIYGDTIYEGGTALADKYTPRNHSHSRSEITDFWSTPFWDNIPDKPSEYPPEAHTHDASDITSGTLSLDRIPLIPYTKLDTVNTPSDGQVLSYSATDDKLKWVDMGGGGVGRVLIGADETEVTTTSKSYTTMKQLKLYKDSTDFNWKTLYVLARIKNSGSYTTYVAVYIDGSLYAEDSKSGTSYAVKKLVIDISGLSDGVHNVEIKIKVSGGTGYIEFTEVWAEP